MIEALGLSLVQALLSFMVTRELDSAFPAAVKGMPSWYGQPAAAHVCESAMAAGALPAALDEATAGAWTRLTDRLGRAAEAAADARVQQTRDDDERALVEVFRSDANLSRFVKSTSALRNQEYRKDAPAGAYVRACITERDIEAYQRTRVNALVRQISRHRRDQADRELREATGGEPPR